MCNKRVFMVVAGGLLLLPTSDATAAGTKPAVPAAALKATFQSLYSRLDAALARKDAASVLTFYADDFVAVGKNGKVTLQGKSQVRKVFAAMMASVTTVRESDIIQELTVAGETVIVTKKSDLTINGKAEGMPSLDRETWIRVGGRWQIKQHRQLE